MVVHSSSPFSSPYPTSNLHPIIRSSQSQDGTVQSYPLVETIQKDNICHIVIAPAQVPPNAVADALQIAKQAIASLPGVLSH